MSLPKLFSRINLFRISLGLFLILGLFAMFFARGRVFAQLDTYVIFKDTLAPDWTNWSWGGKAQFSDQISVVFDAWGGLYLHANAPIDTSSVKYFQFSIKKPDASKFRVFFYDAFYSPIDNQVDLARFIIETRDGFVTYRIPVKDLRVSHTMISGFAIQEISGMERHFVQFDDIFLLREPISGSGLDKVFSDGDGSNWENWSWGGSVVVGNAIDVQVNSNWGALYLRRKEPVLAKEIEQLTFRAKFTDTAQYQVALFGQDSKPLAPFSIISLYKTTDASTGYMTFQVPLQVLANDTSLVSGIVIQDISGTTGKTFSLNEISLVRKSGIIADDFLPVKEAPSITPAATLQPVSAVIDSNGFSVSNNNIYKDGNKILLRGVNWFGFETETYAPHGLWKRNWKDMIAQIKQNGFTSVRVPFCPQTLKDVQTSGIDTKLNPDINGMTSLKLLDLVVTEMSTQGLYVLLDHHRPDCNSISELWYTSNYSESQWIDDLTFVVGRYKNLDNFLGIDLKNEPHGKATWGTGNTATDWNIAAEKAGRAVLSANPNILVFVEGVQENPVCSGNVGHWMGGNLEPIYCTPIDTGSIPANKLVLSPHVYGPDVYPQEYFSEASFPQNMPAIWDTHFGSLMSNGYTIVPGEWGGKYGWGDTKDRIWQDSVSEYFVSKRICNSFYWSWNPNSSDTGGILQDDWISVRTDKMELLNRFWSQCN